MRFLVKYGLILLLSLNLQAEEPAGIVLYFSALLRSEAQVLRLQVPRPLQAALRLRGQGVRQGRLP